MKSSRLASFLPYLAVGLLALFPLVDTSFYLQLLTKVLIMAIFAMSLDLLVGYTGLVSFGHAAYFGLAGYALALMAPKYETVSLWWTLPASIGVCALFALVTGMLVLRTRGIYFIMVTLAFAQMLFFIFHDTKLGGGSDGVYIYAKPTMQWGETVLLNLEKLENFYWLVLVLAAGSYLLLRRILGSSFGRALLGIKVNEHRMRALGFPVFKLSSGVTIGVYICYDRHFPEGARALGLHGAEIVFNPSATVAGLSQYLWKLEQPAHAVANGYYMGCINRVGTEAPWNIGKFYGTSYFVDPRGSFLAVASEDNDELVVSDLDLSVIEEVRRTWQFYRDRRPDAYKDLTDDLP